ncbi:hypothetical protein Tco_0810291 [Tanacetum coccineum]
MLAWWCSPKDLMIPVDVTVLPLIRSCSKQTRALNDLNMWYQSFALRNFDLEDMELESTNSGHTAKLPILKLGEYEMWAIRIKHYFQIQDYALAIQQAPAYLGKAGGVLEALPLVASLPY